MWINAPDGNYEPWLVLGGLVFTSLEIIRRYGSNILKKDGKISTLIPWVKYWLNRPVILPHQQQNWWHMGRTGDQKPTMQIVGYWYITNTTDQPINVLNCYIKRPWTQGHVSLKDVHSSYHGSYPIPPHTTTDLHAYFWIHPPIRKEGRDLKLDIVFVDQYGQKRTLENTVFKSRKHKGSVPIKLDEETVYKLEHEVEKKVASVLKDEINRYKKYGRKFGELGSLHATYNKRKIKSIYQDSWTDSKSGERQEIISDPENAHVFSENGDTLVNYYNSLKEESEKELFINSLISRLNREKEYYCVSYLILYVLFRTGHLEQGLEAAKNGLPKKKSLLDILFRRKPKEELLESHQRHGYSDALGLINGLLRYEHPSFKETDLDLIEKFITDTDEHTFQISEKISSARSFRLGQQKY